MIEDNIIEDDIITCDKKVETKNNKNNDINTTLLNKSINILINDTLDYIIQENVNIYHLLFIFLLNDVFSGIIVFNMILENIVDLDLNKFQIIKNRLDDDNNIIYPLLLSILLVINRKLKLEDNIYKEYHHVYKNIYNIIEQKVTKQLLVCTQEQ